MRIYAERRINFAYRLWWELLEEFKKRPDYNEVEDVVIPLFQALLKSENEYGWAQNACTAGSIAFILALLLGPIPMDFENLEITNKNIGFQVFTNFITGSKIRETIYFQLVSCLREATVMNNNWKYDSCVIYCFFPTPVSFFSLKQIEF